MTMSPLNAALVAADSVLRAEALSCIEQLPVRVISDQKVLSTTCTICWTAWSGCGADVVILEANLLKIPLEEFARRLKLTASEPAIFILHTEAVATSILEAMQAGAREYICPPLAAPLKEALVRLSAVRGEHASHQQRKLGRVFGFISAKGGSGATTFTSHVATMAARHGDKRTLLADVDFEAGLLRFILKAKPRYSLRDALDNMHRMDSSYWNALVVRHGEKLEFIAAPEELAERTIPDARQLGRLLRFLRTIYPLAFLDFGRCYSTAALESLPEMDTLYLLTTQDLHTLENARDFLRLAEERAKGADRIKVLLNKVPARQKPDLDSLESYLGIRPENVFSDDAEALYEIWSEGRMLGSDSALGRELGALAKSILAQDMPEPVAKQTAGKRSRDKSAAVSPMAALKGLGRFLPFTGSSRA